MDKKILIVEDDVNILYSLQAKFSSDGFQVFTNPGAESIEELKKMIKDLQIDYIILDIVLPSLDGFTLLAELKSDDTIGKLPIFIFSNLSDRDTQEKCKRLGAEHFFVKDKIILDDLVQKIKKIIANREKTKL